MLPGDPRTLRASGKELHHRHVEIHHRLYTPGLAEMADRSGPTSHGVGLTPPRAHALWCPGRLANFVGASSG